MTGLVEIWIDGARCEAPGGVPLAHLLSGRGGPLRRSPRAGAARGVFCGMGLCFECVVRVDGQERRSCLTPIEAGMRVETLTPGRAEP